MERLTMAVPCLFGLEGLVGDELRRMGMEQVRVEDRRVFLKGTFSPWPGRISACGWASG